MRLGAGARVGYWTLKKRLGEGGMSEVWRASSDDGTDVAIKLVHHAGAGFEVEAAALARLVHPRIIRILDFGVADDGRPFLALELARGPSLEQFLAETQVTWQGVLEVSRRVLEALAHAHSRGLVHRDVKPANVLAMERGGSDWRLTDFGIARSGLDHSEERNPSGTPRYMAPEQFLGRGHEQGPWTDLYALGCIIYQMVTGYAPFRGDAPTQLAFSHLRDPVPALAPRIGVPAGLEPYLSVLLRKDPLSRFRSAADALRALETLGPARGGTVAAAEAIAPESDRTMITPPFEPTVLLGDLAEFEWQPGTDAPIVAPPAPMDEPPASSPRHYFATFHGDTGPALTGLRELPLVGRLRERTAIWTTLREAIVGRERHVAILHGGSGTGKSAIGRWLVQSVEEHGLGTTIRVDEQTSPHEALIAALQRAFRLHTSAATTLRRWASPPDWAIDTVARAVAGDDLPPDDVVSAALAVVWARAAIHPVVLWIDDVDRDSRWVELLRRVATHPIEDVPLLVLGAAQTSRDDVDRNIALDPFSAGECAGLITELVGIPPEEAFAVAHAVDNNPRLAVEVMRDWIAQGHLVRVAGRWRLRAGGLPRLPDSVSDVRTQRFVRLVGTVPDDGFALELLAVYGDDCPVDDWGDACRLAGIKPSSDILARATRQSVIEHADGKLRFVDGVLRRELLQRTPAARRRAHHRALARLTERGDYPPSFIGTHLFEAGDLTASMPFLLEGMRGLQRGGVARAELLDRYRRATQSLGLEDEESGAWGRFMEAKHLHDHWRGTDALPIIEEVMATSAARGWADLELEATVMYVTVASARAPTRADGDVAAHAIALADATGDSGRRADARNAAGAMFGYLGELDRAQAVYSEARDIAVASGNTLALADADYGIGWVRFLRGELREALVPLNHAISLMFADGRTQAAESVRSLTGDVLRALGDLDEAEAVFTQAFHYFSRHHVLESVMPVNFAVLAVARGQFDAAVRWARRGREIELERGRQPVLVTTWAVELLGAAARGDAATWDEAFEELDRLWALDDANFDLAYVLDFAARETAGSLDAARRDAVVARGVEIWSRLGRTDEARALERVGSATSTLPR